MNLRSPAVLVVGVLTLVMLVAALALLIPALFRLGWTVASAMPLVLMIFGIFDCIRSGKPGNTILLWVVIIILAPLLGPSLWFAWGRKHT